MVDIVDIANDYAQVALDASVSAAARDIPAGEPGICIECDEWVARLVGGVCPVCRDTHERLRARLYAR